MSNKIIIYVFEQNCSFWIRHLVSQVILESTQCACNVYNICGSATEYGYASRSSLTKPWLEVSLPVYLVDRHRSGTMEQRMNEEARMRRLPYMAHKTSLGAMRSPTNRHRRSWQPIPAILIWPFVRREIPGKSGWKTAGKKIAEHHEDRTNRNPSVGRSADRIKAPWIIHRRDRARGPTTGSLPACLRCASSTRAYYPFPSTRHEAMVKANLHAVFFMIIFRIKKEAHNLCFRTMIKTIICKTRTEELNQSNVFVYFNKYSGQNVLVFIFVLVNRDQALCACNKNSSRDA